VKGYVDVFMMIVGAITFVVVFSIQGFLMDMGIWRHIISISVGVMVIGVGYIVGSKLEG
jgi:hypothetical protein